MNKEKNQGIQCLRAVAAILVLIQHVLWYVLEHYKYDLSYVLRTHIGSTGVGIFFVISGFVITLSMKQNKMFFVNRVLRIYPPFLFMVVISLVVFSDSKFTLSSILLLPSLDFNSSYRIPYWTLVYEMFFYTVLYALILIKLSKERLLMFMVMWLITIIMVNLFVEVYFPVPHFKIFFSSINIFFIFGVCIALNKEPYITIPNYQLFLIIVIGYQYISNTSGTLCHTIQALVCSAILLLFMKLKVPKIWIMLGNSSYGLYLMHNLVIVGVVGLVGRYNINIKFYTLCILAFVLSFVVGTAYGYIESELHKKLANWVKQKTSTS